MTVDILGSLKRTAIAPENEQEVQNPGWLGYIWHYTTHLYGDHSKPTYKDPYEPTRISWNVIRVLNFERCSNGWLEDDPCLLGFFTPMRQTAAVEKAGFPSICSWKAFLGSSPIKFNGIFRDHQ